MPYVVYVASPVDVGNDLEEIEKLRRQAAEEARQMGLMAFDPANAIYAPSDGLGWENDRRLWEYNFKALTLADAVLLILPEGYASTGAGMEVERAASLGKPVGVYGGWHSWMLSREGVVRFTEITRALSWIKCKLDHSDGSTVTQQEVLRYTYRGEHEGNRLTRGYSDDAGIDLYVEETKVIDPGVFTYVPTGVSIELPPAYWGWITGRSSAARMGLQVVNGIIDTGFRGELLVGCWNMTPEPVTVEANTRIGQLIVMPNLGPQFRLERTEKLNGSVRGTNGFGSTNKVATSERTHLTAGQH